MNLKIQFSLNNSNWVADIRPKNIDTNTHSVFVTGGVNGDASFYTYIKEVEGEYFEVGDYSVLSQQVLDIVKSEFSKVS